MCCGEYGTCYGETGRNRKGRAPRTRIRGARRRDLAQQSASKLRAVLLREQLLAFNCSDKTAPPQAYETRARS